MEVSKRAQIRKNLNAYTFDASSYLEPHVSTVSIDAADPEKKLFALFDKLTKQFTDLSLDIEEDVTGLQNQARHTERQLLHEMEYNSEKLVEVGDAVDSVKLSFDLASEGAVRIGGKLSAAERERSHIEKSIELLGYIKVFQDTPADKYTAAVKENATAKELRDALPAGLQKKNWGTISEMLHDLKKILFELNSEDIRNANNNITRVADRVEMELLQEFEKVIINLISDKHEDPRLIERAKELAEWLHLYNNGQSIQKRYIFTVVQHRIPNDTFFQNNVGFSEHGGPGAGNKTVKNTPKSGAPTPSTTLGWLWGSKPTNAAQLSQSRHPGGEDDNFSDDGSTPGQSTHYPLIKTASMDSGGFTGGLSLMDHLSGLFSMINTVCQEQFSIIRNVFPAHTIAKVTRMLIQRIFNDPAFGIQARVDAILCPAPPQPPLSLPDYLDALVIVREKLSALFLLLLECCSHPSMRGMGSESAALKKAKINLPYGRTKRSNHDEGEQGKTYGSTNESRAGNGSTNHHGHGGGDHGHGHGNHQSGGNMFVDADEEAEEILHSDAEIREFFDDQIGQVFSTYLADYFAKESQHVRNQYSELLRDAVEDATMLSKPDTKGPLQLPLLRADRIKTILSVVQSVGNKVFLNRVFSVTTDTVCRMESIGRDDKKLTHRIKDLFLLQLAFLSEGMLIPWSKACITVLLKQLANRNATTMLPPSEILALLTVLTYGVSRIKSHFDEVFLRPLSIVPNIVAVCKENRMKAFRDLDMVARQIIYAWTLCAAAQVERTLTTLQSKYDYAPKFEAAGVKQEPTTACDTACKTITAALNAVRQYEAKLLGLDLVKLFWRPFGQQLVGIIITHVRKQKITPEGYKALSRDLKEYSKVLMFVEAPDIMDLMSCLKELAVVFNAPAASMVKLVVEDLRYLDTPVLLAFVRARADFVSREPTHYANLISAYYSSMKSDTPLSWENRKPVTQAALTDAAAQGTKWTSTLGPNSLRRTAGPSGNPVSALFMAEVARTSTLTPAQLTANGRSVTVDLTRIEEDDDLESVPVRALSVNDARDNRRSTNFSGGYSASQFLPNRPDDASILAATNAAQASAQVQVNAKAGNAIARPDHIISGTAAAANSKNRPHSSVIKSSAATLLSVGANNTAEKDKASKGRVVSMAAPSVTTSSPEPTAGVAAPPPKRLLGKMASFFQGKS